MEGVGVDDAVVDVDAGGDALLSEGVGTRAADADDRPGNLGDGRGEAPAGKLVGEEHHLAEGVRAVEKGDGGREAFGVVRDEKDGETASPSGRRGDGPGGTEKG